MKELWAKMNTNKHALSHVPFLTTNMLSKFWHPTYVQNDFKVILDEKMMYIQLFSKINISIPGNLRYYISYLTTSRYWNVSLTTISLIKSRWYSSISSFIDWSFPDLCVPVWQRMMKYNEDPYKRIWQMYRWSCSREVYEEYTVSLYEIFLTYVQMIV